MPVTLIRADTLQPVLTLPGIVSGTHLYDGTVTDHPMADRSTRADGVLLRPRVLTLSGRIGTLMGDGTPGAAGRVIAALRDLQISQVAVIVQVPGREGIPSMAVERFDEGIDRTNDPTLTVQLKEQLTATSRTVTLAALPPTPRPDVAAGQADTEERGVLPTRSKSISAAGVDQLAERLQESIL